MSKYIYLLRCLTRYKIGIADKVGSRLKAIQTGVPFEIVVVDYARVDNAAMIEKALHKTYAHKRALGEWFDLEPFDVDEIANVFNLHRIESNQLDNAGNESTARINTPSPTEAAMLKLLTPAEKLAALIEAAKRKAGKLTSKPAGATVGQE